MLMLNGALEPPEVSTLQTAVAVLPSSFRFLLNPEMEHNCCKTLQTCVFSSKTGVAEASAGPRRGGKRPKCNVSERMLHKWRTFSDPRCRGRPTSEGRIIHHRGAENAEEMIHRLRRWGQM